MMYHLLSNVIKGGVMSLQIDPSSNDYRPILKLIVYFFFNIHYYIFLIGFLVRYNRHKTLGFINLMESRPRTYKIKILLQVIMGLSTLTMALDLDWEDGKYDFDPLSLIYIVYSVTWILSVYLQFFEYKRNLPHAWYTHQMFWLLSSLLSAVSLATLFYYQYDVCFDSQGNLYSNCLIEKHVLIKMAIVHVIFILISAILTYMGFKFNREHP